MLDGRVTTAIPPEPMDGREPIERGCGAIDVLDRKSLAPCLLALRLLTTFEKEALWPSTVRRRRGTVKSM
jgi:hypothetical protein